jgi:hypothetical protein
VPPLAGGGDWQYLRTRGVVLRAWLSLGAADEVQQQAPHYLRALSVFQKNNSRFLIGPLAV